MNEFLSLSSDLVSVCNLKGRSDALTLICLRWGPARCIVERLRLVVSPVKLFLWRKDSVDSTFLSSELETMEDMAQLIIPRRYFEVKALNDQAYLQYAAGASHIIC